LRLCCWKKVRPDKHSDQLQGTAFDEQVGKHPAEHATVCQHVSSPAVQSHCSTPAACICSKSFNLACLASLADKQHVMCCCVHAVYRSFIAAEAANDPELAALLAKNAALMQETEQQQQQQQQEIRALPAGTIAESAEGGFYTAAGPHDLVVHIATAGPVAAAATSPQVSIPVPCDAVDAVQLLCGVWVAYSNPSLASSVSKVAVTFTARNAVQ
jgi:hypothetical protein